MVISSRNCDPSPPPLSPNDGTPYLGSTHFNSVSNRFPVGFQSVSDPHGRVLESRILVSIFPIGSQLSRRVYPALQLLHNRIPPLPSSFKDFKHNLI